ncbi:hypothetical protein ES703_25065 [subsurface metagenome]
MKIFISYPDVDGLDKAEIAHTALKKYKHNPWYFKKNVTLGYIYWEELSYRIREWCDVFLYISTKSSPSDGQKWEIAQALNVWTKIAILAIPIDNARVHRTIDVFAYHRGSSSNNLDAEFEYIAKHFLNILERYKRLGKELKIKELVQ